MYKNDFGCTGKFTQEPDRGRGAINELLAEQSDRSVVQS